MDDKKAQPEEQQIRSQPSYLVKPDEPITLIDGFVIEHRSDGMVVLSLFMSDQRREMDSRDKSSWNSFCQGRFAMTERTFELLQDLTHRKKGEDDQ